MNATLNQLSKPNDPSVTGAAEYASESIRELKLMEKRGPAFSVLAGNVRATIRNAIDSIEYEMRYAKEHGLQ